MESIAEQDARIIAKYAVGTRGRAKMELQIVRQVLADLHEAHYTIEVFDGDEHIADLTDYQIVDMLFNLDEAHLFVRKLHQSKSEFVFFVFGNEGWNVVSDYSTGLEEVLKKSELLADSLEENR